MIFFPFLAQRLSHSIGVQKQKSFHYSNLNGKENSESQAEEKGNINYANVWIFCQEF